MTGTATVSGRLLRSMDMQTTFVQPDDGPVKGSVLARRSEVLPRWPCSPRRATEVTWDTRTRDKRQPESMVHRYHMVTGHEP